MPAIEITRDPKKRRQAASIPGAVYSRSNAAFYLDLDAADEKTLRALATLFPEHADVIPKQNIGDIRPEDCATPWAGARTVEQLLPGVPAHMRDKLYRYQAVDAAFLSARLAQDGGAYLGWDRGLGKTFAAFVIAAELGARKVIVVTPNQSKNTTWLPEYYNWVEPGAYEGIYVVGNNKAARERAVKTWQMASRGILVVHYEALRYLMPDKKHGLSADLVICDEAHRLAHGGNASQSGVPQFYRALQRITCEWRLALSGSVIVNDPQDMFGALHWLMPKRYSAKWRDWNDRFMQYVDDGWGKVCVGIKPGMEAELRRELATLMCVRYKEDELPGLPDKIVETKMIDLSPGQRKVYDSLLERFWAELPDGKTVVTPSILGQLAKLRQVACGLDLLGGQFDDSAKLDLAEEMVLDVAPNKTVVFTWHVATAQVLAARLKAKGVSAVTVHGGISHKNRDAAVKAFQEDPTVTCIIATIKTLGESVTLHAAANMIFVEASWTPADMDQAADRIYRIGQEHRVTITHIVARNTVDELRVLPRLKQKADMRMVMFGGSNGRPGDRADVAH